MFSPHVYLAHCQDAYNPESLCFGCGPANLQGLKLKSTRIPGECRQCVDHSCKMRRRTKVAAIVKPTASNPQRQTHSGSGPRPPDGSWTKSAQRRKASLLAQPPRAACSFPGGLGRLEAPVVFSSKYCAFPGVVSFSIFAMLHWREAGGTRAFNQILGTPLGERRHHRNAPGLPRQLECSHRPYG